MISSFLVVSDHTHPAATQLLCDFVVGDGLADHGLVHRLITGTNYVELLYPARHHSVAELQVQPTGRHDVYLDGRSTPGTAIDVGPQWGQPSLSTHPPEIAYCPFLSTWME